MINRYTRPEMRALFEDENRFEAWLRVEIETAQAFADDGIIDAKTMLKIRNNAHIDVNRIYELEKETRHDVVAFTRQVSETLGEERRWIHYGLTSTDVVDTAYGIIYKQANEMIRKELENVSRILKEKALLYKDVPCIGRTHGIHADITSFGLKYALWYDELNRHILRFDNAARDLEVGKISGAVGNFANVSPVIQDRVCATLGLQSANISTQVLQRDRHAYFIATCALIGTFIEKVVLEVRHLQRTEVHEVQEFFHKGQKGSSAMPHKQNPISSENLTGCARILRGYLIPAYEDVPLWHERDISHSSAERIMMPDTYQLLDYMLARFGRVMDTLLVHEEHMLANIHKTHGVIFAQRVLYVLLEHSNLSREAAYDLIQPLALQAYDTQTDFKALLLANSEIMRIITREILDEAFDVMYFLNAVDTIYQRVGLKENYETM